MPDSQPFSLAAVLAVIDECRKRLEGFALSVLTDFEFDFPVESRPGMSVDDFERVLTLRVTHTVMIPVDASEFNAHEIYLTVRLQTPKDGYVVAAQILVDLRSGLGEFNAGEHVVFEEQRQTTSLDEALADLRELTERLCSHEDLPVRLGAVRLS